MISPNHQSIRFPDILLSLLPAILCGCSPNVLPEDDYQTWNSSKSLTSCFIYSTIPSDGSTLDILTFENDLFQRLDSYKRFETDSNGIAAVESTAGEKIFFFCKNGQRARYDWVDIQSYSSLYKIRCDIENEQKDRLTMTGECRAEAGSLSNELILTPLVSKVTLSSISCDFSGTPYAGKTIDAPKIYLTNVNATYPLLDEEHQASERIINAGMLNYADMKKFLTPDIICREIECSIGNARLQPEISLLCYPNYSTEESPGTPRTRLVIEGTVDSVRYYWPITVNAEGDGIARNCIYNYDIHIRRKGMSDPDIPIEPKDIETNMKICKWKEIDEYEVTF